jgi:hypothetical protein
MHLLSGLMGVLGFLLALIAVFGADTPPFRLLFGVPALGLLVGSMRVSEWEDSKITEGPDAGVARLLQNLPGSRFVLYLRPFSQDAYYVANPAWFPFAKNRPQTIDVETLFVRAFRGRRRLVKIHSDTRPIDGVGDAVGDGIGGVAPPDNEWQQTFVALSQHARVILMMPGASDGVMIELRSLKDRNLLSRCVFVLCPRATGDRAWRRAEYGLEQLGIALPEGGDKHDWAIFRVGAGHHGVVDCRHVRSDRLIKHLQDIVADVIGENSPVGSWRRHLIVRRWHRIRRPALTAAVIGLFLLAWSL